MYVSGSVCLCVNALTERRREREKERERGGQERGKSAKEEERNQHSFLVITWGNKGKAMFCLKGKCTCGWTLHECVCMGC